MRRTPLRWIGLGACLGLGSVAPASAQRSADSVARAVRADAVRGHMEFLAADALEGRGSGTWGGELAARYVAAQFERLGLEPAGENGTWFQPIPLRGRTFTSSLAAPMEVVNVVGRLPGRRPKESVLLGAHYDHLGIGRPVGGDSIYNGALDNASGTAGMLAIAEAFVTARVHPRRSVLFAAFGAEEAGLLGSAAFVARPTVPLETLSAMLNIDGVNLLADTRDINALGADLSSLDGLFRAAARAEGYAITPPDSPIMLEAVRQDFFNRSDQTSFVRAGVPAALLYFGDRVGRLPPGSGKERLDDYLAHRYHQSTDDLQQPFDFAAGVRSLRVVARTLLAAADAAAPVQWKQTSPYQRNP